MWERADDLAWLGRCVIEHLDALMEAGRRRATLETIAAFLAALAPRQGLAELDPEGEPAHRLRSVFYVNLRVGQVMRHAAELAQAAGRVYAEQAVERLARAAALQPHLPDAYRALQPLLTDRRYGVADKPRWVALVRAAPEELRRRLGR